MAKDLKNLNVQNSTLSLGLLLAGMVLFLFSNGNWTVPIANWLAPVFLLRFVRDLKALWKLILLFVLFCLSTYFMLYGIIPSLLGLLTCILTVYYAMLWFIPYIIDRFLVKRVKGFVSTLIFPVTVVSVEYLNNVIYGSWASIAYSQYDHLPLI